MEVSVAPIRLSPRFPYRAANRLKLTAAATAAANAEIANAVTGPDSGYAENTIATKAAPVVCPNSRAVACIPLAPPAA